MGIEGNGRKFVHVDSCGNRRRPVGSLRQDRRAAALQARKRVSRPRAGLPCRSCGRHRFRDHPGGQIRTTGRVPGISFLLAVRRALAHPADPGRPRGRGTGIPTHTRRPGPVRDRRGHTYRPGARRGGLFLLRPAPSSKRSLRWKAGGRRNRYADQRRSGQPHGSFAGHGSPVRRSHSDRCPWCRRVHRRAEVGPLRRGVRRLLPP